MSTNLYVGIGDKARKVSDIYIGVDGEARKVRRAYVGDSNGKARLWWDTEPALPENCLTFSSEGSFSLSPKHYSDSTTKSPTVKTWDGTMEYSQDGKTWKTWSGSSISGVKKNGVYYLFVRGYGNTYLMPASGDFSNNRSAWYITTSGDNLVDCSGNLITLIDYKKVVSGIEPTLANNFAKYLFNSQTKLRSAPDILISSIPNSGCLGMFWKCSSLEKAGVLSAATVKNSGYNNMFYSCSKLTKPPELPATTLDTNCYTNMFQNCISLTTAPNLPAKTLKSSCYYGMFRGCVNLVNPPRVSATEGYSDAFSYTFADCSSLTTAPDFSEILGEGGFIGTFQNCSSLINIPIFNFTHTSTSKLKTFEGCSSLKVSQVKSTDYPIPYKIPNPTYDYDWATPFEDFFIGTGGTFTGNPTAGGTYYLHTSCDTVPSSK